jgi:hypothetical protein
MTAVRVPIQLSNSPRGARPHCRDADCARALRDVRPPVRKRAQGRPGARCTRGLVRRRVKRKAHTSIQVQRKHSGLPCAVVYGLLRALPGDRLSCHRRRRDTSRPLDASTGASGPHDFAVRVSRRSSFAAIRVHRIPPRVRDDREPPLSSGETGQSRALICAGSEAEYFSRGGWTTFWVICPSG